MRNSLIGKLGRALGAFALVLAASAAVVWPIWALATRSRRLFTALVGAGLLLALGFAVAAKLRRRRRGARI